MDKQQVDKGYDVGNRAFEYIFQAGIDEAVDNLIASPDTKCFMDTLLVNTLTRLPHSCMEELKKDTTSNPDNSFMYTLYMMLHTAITYGYAEGDKHIRNSMVDTTPEVN